MVSAGPSLKFQEDPCSIVSDWYYFGGLGRCDPFGQVSHHVSTLVKTLRANKALCSGRCGRPNSIVVLASFLHDTGTAFVKSRHQADVVIGIGFGDVDLPCSLVATDEVFRPLKMTCLGWPTVSQAAKHGTSHEAVANHVSWDISTSVS